MFRSIEITEIKLFSNLSLEYQTKFFCSYVSHKFKTRIILRKIPNTLKGQFLILFDDFRVCACGLTCTPYRKLWHLQELFSLPFPTHARVFRRTQQVNILLRTNHMFLNTKATIQCFMTKASCYQG